MTAAVRHPAGHATYTGDHRGIIGQLKGPTTYGSYTVAVAAVYDHDANTTRVAFDYATEADVTAARGPDRHSLTVPGLVATP